jgi:hypothetical protein
MRTFSGLVLGGKNGMVKGGAGAAGASLFEVAHTYSASAG